jgi:uncharacterized protein
MAGETPMQTPSVADPVVSRTAEFVRAEIADDCTGHDWWHAERVRRISCRLAAAESADRRVVELAALLHDVADYKFSGDVREGPRVARRWLESCGVGEEVADHVVVIIETMSFAGARVPDREMSREGACVRDADRLDAIGAIGIARTFAYGGYVRRPIHDPGRCVVLHDDPDAYRSDRGTTLNHFREKLLLVQDRLVTSAAQQIGKRRHDYLLGFLDEFEREWDAADADDVFF